MDQAVIINYQQLSKPLSENRSVLQQTFYYEPINAKERAHRGTLCVIVELNNRRNDDLDLSKLSQSVFTTIQDKYYDYDNTGGPLEELENALELAKAHGHKLSQNKANIKLAALSVWGKSVLYVNPYLLPMGVRRNNEYFELDEPPIGVELLKHDDLVFAGNSSLFNKEIKPLLRDDQASSNTEILESITSTLEQPTEASPIVSGLIAHISLHKVPSEDEIIEIHYPEEFKQKSKKPKPILTVVGGIEQKFMELLSKRMQRPSIYVKSEGNGRKKRFAIAGSALGLLLVSIAVTYNINRTQERSTNLEEVIGKTSENLNRAEELALLNPDESLALLNVAENDLGSVLGDSDIKDERLDALTDSIADIRQMIFNTTPKVPQETSLAERIATLDYSIQGEAITNTEGRVVLESASEWQSPTHVATYYDNLYILDPAANAIWKYTPAGNEYYGPQQYIQDGSDINKSIDLTIDGAVFVLFPNRIDKFLIGKRETFSIRGVFPPISQESRIATSIDSTQLYVSTTEGIAVFSKEGRYERLLTGEHMGSIEKLFVDPAGETIWFFSDGAWWTVIP